MTLLEAIKLRHSVRRYRTEPISENVLAKLKSEIDTINKEGDLHIQLVTDEPKAFNGPMAYGKFDGRKEISRFR